MGYKSKTYSLSDEVVAAIEAARGQGETPNQLFSRVIVTHVFTGINSKPIEQWSKAEVTFAVSYARNNDPDTYQRIIKILDTLPKKRNSRPPREKGKGKR